MSADGSTNGFWDDVRERFVTADAVYGTILYSALIAGVSDDDSPALEVLIVAAISLLIFWAAHVFAGTVATHGRKNRLSAALWHSIGHSSGMLYAAILPSLTLLLGVFGVVSTDDAVNLALLVAMLILGFLGYKSFEQRATPVVVRILGGLGTALFGLLIILLNIIVH